MKGTDDLHGSHQNPKTRNLERMHDSRSLQTGSGPYKKASNRSPRVDFFGTIPGFSTTWRIGKSRCAATKSSQPCGIETELKTFSAAGNPQNETKVRPPLLVAIECAVEFIYRRLERVMKPCGLWYSLSYKVIKKASRYTRGPNFHKLHGVLS